MKTYENYKGFTSESLSASVAPIFGEFGVSPTWRRRSEDANKEMENAKKKMENAKKKYGDEKEQFTSRIQKEIQDSQPDYEAEYVNQVLTEIFEHIKLKSPGPYSEVEYINKVSEISTAFSNKVITLLDDKEKMENTRAKVLKSLGINPKVDNNNDLRKLLLYKYRTLKEEGEISTSIQKQKNEGKRIIRYILIK